MLPSVPSLYLIACQSVEAASLADFRSAGVNRLSLGVQSLNDEDLRYLGRNHDSKVDDILFSSYATLTHR